jgi:hypothetical protein
LYCSSKEKKIEKVGTGFFPTEFISNSKGNRARSASVLGLKRRIHKIFCKVIMGIHGLMRLLSEECPQAIKEHEVFNFYFVCCFFGLNLDPFVMLSRCCGVGID